MDNAERRAMIAVPIVVLIGAGLAWAGSQGGQAAGELPLYAVCIGLAFIVNWIAFLPSFANRTEKFYDLTGGITYLSVVLVSLALNQDVDSRALLLGGLVAIWALRLSSFLFNRIRAAGEDRRFRELKQSFWRFLLAWSLQGLWVSFSLAAALAAITSEYRKELGWIAALGLLVWLVGFGIEVVADRQKSAFNARPENKGRFISTGLWAWSRHPNYFGEIVLWIGIAIIAIPVLQGWQWATLISPIFIYILLTRISGVPMLEARADEKWGGEPEYEAYKAGTPELFMRPPSK